MTGKVSLKLEMPYLQAIQSVPGDTAGEKLSWIGKLASCKDEVIGELDKLPSKLQPLLEVETAIKYQRYENIASALKSNDWTIVKRAFKAAWFFDGNHTTVNAEYFGRNIFPYISLHTRIRLVRTFVRRIKSATFAQKIFAKLEQIYDYRTALPLIACCDEVFAYNTVVERKRVLPLGVFKKIFRRNLDLAVRLLKSFIFDCHEYVPVDKEIVENDPCDIIERYKSFLSLLPKSRPMDFVDIVETVAHCPNIKVMSNKSAKKFLRKAEKQVAEYPHLYMPILPSKAINSEQMELMFPALMKYHRDSFDTNLMLNYLKDYPKDKKVALLCKTFKDVYHDELLNDTKRVTFELLKILPSCDRNKQVEIKINDQSSTNVCSHVASTYHGNWICYSSLEIAIPVLKSKLNHTKCEKERANCLTQTIYACLVNEDDNELRRTLTYIKNICETLNFASSKLIIDSFLLIFNMRSVYLSKKSVILMDDILLRVYQRHNCISKLVLEEMLHLKIVHKMSINNLIYVLINLYQHQMSNIEFNLLKDYPLYERQCLVTFICILQKFYSDMNQEMNKNKKYDSVKRERKKLREEKNTVACRLIVAMYDFNYRCKKSHVREYAKLTIKNYPWLMDTIHAIMRSEQVCLFFKEAQDVLRKQEREIYYNIIFPSTLTEIADVKSGAALRLLKRNLQSIQDNWEEYFIYCKRNCNNKQVQNFVRAIRWYGDIPIKFARQCMDHLRRKITNKKSVLILLSLLLHGDTIQKLIDSYTTVKKNSSNHSQFMNHLSISMKFLNPPLLKFFIHEEIFDKRYLSTTLMTLRSVSRRSSLSEVILFSDNFQNMNVQLRKQWIDLMYAIVATNYFVTFLEEIWSLERHRSIRQLLLNTVQRLLYERPRKKTWVLCCKIFLSLSVEEEQLFWKMKDYMKNISGTYSEAYFNLWLHTINGLSVAGLSDKRTKEHTVKCLKYLHQYIKSEQYVVDIFQRLFACSNISIIGAMRSFVVKYLLKSNNDKLAKYSKLIFKTFFLKISSSWNVSHPSDRFFYPTKTVVHSYFEQFIIAYMRRRKDENFDGRVLDYMLLIFSTVLTPTQDIQSYLLLVFAKKLHAFSYITPIVDNNFGLQLGQIMPDLTNVISHYMVDFMAVLLDYFLKNIYSSDQYSDVIFNTINGLIDANNTYSNFMAITMLSLQKYCTKHYEILNRALNSFSPRSINAIILYHYLNKASFNDVPLDDKSDPSENIN